MNYLLIPILIPPAVEDIKTREISNIFPITIILTRCIFMFVQKDAEGFFFGLAAVLFTLFMSAISYAAVKDGIGFGDIKLMLALSFYLGITGWLRALLFISVISLASSLFLIIRKKAKKDTSLPFVPFILAGVTLSLLFEVF